MRLLKSLIVGLSMLSLVHGFDQQDLEQTVNTASQRTDQEEPLGTPWYTEDYNALMKGLTEIRLETMINSALILFGEKTFPIATNFYGDVVIGGLNLGPGSGRVIMMGRGGWVRPSAPETVRALMHNALRWLAQKQENFTTATNMNEDIAGTDQATLRNVQPSQLATVKPDVYVIHSRDYKYSEDDSKSIQEYVANGGGLIMAGHVWSVTNKNFVETISCNQQIAIKYGMFVTWFDWHRSLYNNTHIVPSPYHNVYHAIKLIAANGTSTVGDKTVGRTIHEILLPFTMKLPEFAPLVDLAFKTLPTMDSQRYPAGYSGLAKVLPNLLAEYPELLKPASWSAQFPGEVPATVPRFNKTVKVMASYANPQPGQFSASSAGVSILVSTGLYAPPGEIVEITVPAAKANELISSNINVQIGINTDTLYNTMLNNGKIRRNPAIIVRYSITGETTKTGNPWGGPVYIKVPRGVDVGELEVTVSNVVEYPRFIYGVHTNEDWNARIKDLPGPTTEFEVPGEIIISLPGYKVREYAPLDPESIMNKWNETMMAVNRLAGITKRWRPERFNLDIQTSGAYMHSGYPMMGWAGSAGYLLFKKNSSIWGATHELGHNHQWSSWNMAHTGENTANLWSVYVHEKVFNRRHHEAHPNLAVDRAVKRLYNWVMAGRPEAGYTGTIVIDTLSFLADTYGWEPYMRFHGRYYTMPRIRDNSQKQTTYAQLFSIEANTNLCSYFEWLRFHISNETWTVCNSLPNATVNPLEKYQKFEADLPTSHVQCKDGWHAYGDSCFFFSTEEKNFWDAEDACSSMADDSHLASCLTLPETFHLQELKKKAEYSKYNYFMGLHEMNPEGKFVYLDGTEPTEMLPWGGGNPKGGADNVHNCGVFVGSNLEDHDCTHRRRFICKAGPTSCKPKMTCPSGWALWGDKCLKADGSVRVKTYDEGVAKCKEMDQEASLAEIQSKQEQHMMAILIRRQRWDRGIGYWRPYLVGMTDVPNLKWASGASSPYEFWCSNWHKDPQPGMSVIMGYWGLSCWEDWLPRRVSNIPPSIICQRPGTPA